MPPIEGTSHRSLADIAREHIMRDIIQRKLQPGEIVQLKDLAEEYGMSRTPVREALTGLKQSGLVLAIPYKGYRIRPLERKDIEDVIFMRELLETKAAELAAVHITDEQIDELRRLVPPDASDLTLEFDRYSERFHHLVGQASQSQRLAEMISMVYNDVLRLQYASMSHAVPTEIVDEHRQILEALENRDPAAAREAMSGHVLKVHARALDEVATPEPEES